jgi:hypothetical protein
MRKAIALFLFISIVVGSGPLQAAIWPWKWNQLNKAGDRQGRWRAFYEHKPSQLMYRGRFMDGVEKGTWKTYSEHGHLERKEKYQPRHKRIITVFYHPNGKVSHQGMAFQFVENNMLMYKWHGEWNYYDAAGKWLGWRTFNRGISMSQELVSSKP